MDEKYLKSWELQQKEWNKKNLPDVKKKKKKWINLEQEVKVNGKNE